MLCCATQVELFNKPTSRRGKMTNYLKVKPVLLGRSMLQLIFVQVKILVGQSPEADLKKKLLWSKFTHFLS